ncbi:vWA domain-containing protein [Geminocystis herdmanii]|uniref:vWA domain-containing protein n=1 Tax=Geminocystis herdmanii TaxID=669359 RepID=UPI00034615BE|nr:VWA-like domain-containing protein [Geminocystis herdmanii]
MIKQTSQDEEIISASRLRMRVKSPFFATLALFAQFKASYAIDTAATDGKTVFYHPEYLISLPKAQQDGLILHEILHMALLHTIRRHDRDCQLWNIACDIVVNGLIAEDKNYELPPNGIRKPEWETKSVEEIYELLLQQPDESKPSLLMPDLLNQPLADSDNGENSQQEKIDRSDNIDVELTGSIEQHKQAQLKAYWQNAMQQANIVARTTNQGKLPAGMERQFKELQSAQIDWRTYLWRYLVQTPTDFQGFDRRFISRGLYLDTLAGESVQVYVCIDTSGSISDTQMNLFCSELLGILGAYPHLQCQLYYADANIYGGYELKANDDIPKPIGGGGTSFIPFFEQVEKTRDLCLQGVCVYLTDGYGDFPREKPNLPVLWVVVPGGLDMDKFPFGEVVKIY